jgi:hypothetical protein
MHKIIESLMYAQTRTKLNINFDIGMLSMYQSDLGLDHWKVINKVMRYLQRQKITCSFIENLIIL